MPDARRRCFDGDVTLIVKENIIIKNVKSVKIICDYKKIVRTFAFDLYVSQMKQTKNIARNSLIISNLNGGGG
ncbi:hypothetical protein AGMMS49525_04340 [Bacteroidia bacterium]|nr:hypothetical protein AGMMS49525_04340 [Bacteroidia bacterium]